MNNHTELINRFLVENFNNILHWEEKALTGYSGGKLSVNEFHIIEAVYLSQAQNTMGEVSRRLGVTMGTLTTSVKTLERKGYLLRERGEEDRRVVWITPTPAAAEANRFHTAFHRQMVGTIMDCLDHNHLAALTEALSVLANYFAQLDHEESYIQLEQIADEVEAAAAANCDTLV